MSESLHNRPTEPLSLPVSLRIAGCCKAVFGIAQTAYEINELGNELPSVVSENVLGGAERAISVL